MCTVVKVVGGNPDIWNIKGLKNSSLFVSEKDRPRHWNDDVDCLCGVNVQRVLERSGLRFEYDEVEDVYTTYPKERR